MALRGREVDITVLLFSTVPGVLCRHYKSNSKVIDGVIERVEQYGGEGIRTVDAFQGRERDVLHSHKHRGLPFCGKRKPPKRGLRQG